MGGINFERHLTLPDRFVVFPLCYKFVSQIGVGQPSRRILGYRVAP